MWNNINHRNYLLHVAESLCDTQEEQQQHPAQQVPQQPPQATQPDNPAELRHRAHQHLAREETQGRNRAENAEVRTGQKNTNGPGTVPGYPPRPPRNPYPQDSTLAARLVDGARAGGSTTSTVLGYKSKLVRFSAWLRQNKLPSVQSQLFTQKLSDLAARYGREYNVQDLHVVLQHLRAMETSKFGTVHIEKDDRYHLGKIPPEDKWLIDSAFPQKNRRGYDCKSAMSAFSAWLSQQNKTLCGCIASNDLKKPMADFVKERPAAGQKLISGINHLKKFDNNENVKFMQFRSGRDLPEEDKLIIERFRYAEFERLQEKASKNGKTIKLHKQGELSAPRRTTADKYATTLRSFTTWRRTQDNMPGSLASRLHDPVLDSQLERWTNKLDRGFARSAQYTLRRLREICPPGSYHIAPEIQPPHSPTSPSFGAGLPDSGLNENLETSQPGVSSEAQHDLMSQQPYSSLGSAAGGNRSNSPESQPTAMSDAVLSRFPSLDSNTWRSLRDIEPDTPRSDTLAAGNRSLPQHSNRSAMPLTAAVSSGVSSPQSVREFDLNTPQQAIADPEQADADLSDAVPSRFPSLDSNTWRSLREFDIGTPQSAFRPLSTQGGNPSRQSQAGRPGSVLHRLNSATSRSQQGHGINTPQSALQPPASPTISSASQTVPPPGNRPAMQPPASPDSVFGGLSSLGSLPDTEMYDAAPATPQSVREHPALAMTPGHASGQGLNCLLDSILQVYHGVRRSPGIETSQTRYLQHEAKQIRKEILAPLGIAPHRGEIDIYGGAGQLLANNLGVRLQVIQQGSTGELITHPTLGQSGPIIHLLHTPGHFQPLWS